MCHWACIKQKAVLSWCLNVDHMSLPPINKWVTHGLRRAPCLCLRWIFRPEKKTTRKDATVLDWKHYVAVENTCSRDSLVFLIQNDFIVPHISITYSLQLKSKSYLVVITCYAGTVPAAPLRLCKWTSCSLRLRCLPEFLTVSRPMCL